MHYLSVEGLTRSYGLRVLFDQISFHLSEGDKIALVGRNGSGKTTLMNILAGLDTPDSGTVWVSKDIRVAYLKQSPVLNGSRTVLENIFDHHQPVLDAVRDYEALSALGPSADPATLNASISRVDELNGWDLEARVKQILGRLGIQDFSQPAGELSGGQAKRVALAKLLIDTGFQHTHSLLLLDEPTNHLDVGMIEWLEQFLAMQKVSLLMVTHDRYFLDRVCNQIIELDGGRLYAYQGNYAWFLEKKAARDAADRSSAEKARNLLRRELEWIRKQPKARTTKSKSRIDAFQDLEQRASSDPREARMEIQAKMSRMGGKVLEMKKVYKSFGETTILRGFDYNFKRGERVGVIGANGSGKSTFLNLLVGKEQPDSGKINTGETIVFGNYAQEGLVIREDMRIIDYVKGIAEYFPLADGTKLGASEFLNLFLFPPEQQYTYLSSLSGGEKRRLQMLIVLFRNPNFLVMDEPTNDLDLQTLDILNDFLLQFQGCLVLVSHDRYFMDRLVDHLLVFEGGGMIRDFPGNYSQYREDTRKNHSTRPPGAKAGTEKGQGQGQVKKIAAKSSFKEKRELELLEKEIQALESEKKQLEQQLQDPGASFETMAAWSSRLGEILVLLEQKMVRWLELGQVST